MRLSAVSYIKLFSYFLFFISVLCEIERDYKTFVITVNGEPWSLPLLKGLQTRHEFPFRKIVHAEITSGPKSTACVFWSDEEFAWKGIHRTGVESEWLTTFPTANRLFCYDGKEIALPMAIEDMSGNWELIPLYYSSYKHYTAKLKRPMNVLRAMPLRLNRACRFQSRRAFSDEFQEEGLQSFNEAIAIFCRGVY